MTWGGAGACGRGDRVPRSREAEGRFGGPAFPWAGAPSDPPAPHYDGAAMRLEADRGRTGRSVKRVPQAPPGRAPDTAADPADKSGGLRTSKIADVPERSGRGA